MCELTGVSRAGFYRNWETCEPTAAETALRDAIQQAVAGHTYYGYRRITKHIQRHGLVVGAKKVRRGMRQDNLLSIGKSKFGVTTKSEHVFRSYQNLTKYRSLTNFTNIRIA